MKEIYDKLEPHEPALQSAYDALTQVGQATADPDDVWDDYIDQAHQGLGVLLAMLFARRLTRDDAK